MTSQYALGRRWHRLKGLGNPRYQNVGVTYTIDLETIPHAVVTRRDMSGQIVAVPLVPDPHERFIIWTDRP